MSSWTSAPTVTEAVFVALQLPLSAASLCCCGRSAYCASNHRGNDKA
jgi:hypothetical protein